MSYQVLARKARPQSFDEVLGQRTVVKTLQNSLAKDRVAHAIMFSGVRGVGKTTLARIMAKAINCTTDGSVRPCNVCQSCKSIMAGSAIDLYEIDGASNRGIQEIRELREKIRFLPTTSRFKIIIIDEVHMLTNEAFNALLKTLEEPPEHVYFMFATTEIHKIPVTILSRCQRYELQRVMSAELLAHFKKLAAEENIEISDEALSHIVRESEGSVRDGLSLLDQVFSYGEQSISAEDVVEVLGLTNRSLLMELTQALLEGNKSRTFQTLDQLFVAGLDIKRFSSDLLENFRTLLLLKIQDCGDILDLPEDHLQAFTELSGKFSSETIHAQLNLLIDTVDKVRYSAQPRLTLETSFLSIIEAGNIVSIPTLLDKLDQHLQSSPNTINQKSDGLLDEEKKNDATQVIQEDSRQQSQAVEIIAEKPHINIAPEVDQAPPPDPPDPPPHELSEPLTERESEELSEKEHFSDAASKKPEIHPHEKDVRKDWSAFTEYVKERVKWMGIDLQRVDRPKEQDGELHLHYDDALNCSVLKQDENRKQLTEFVLDFFQKELKVRFITPDDQDSSHPEGTESPQKKRQELANDPLVIMAAETFNGQVGDIRIGQRSR